MKKTITQFCIIGLIILTGCAPKPSPYYEINTYPENNINTQPQKSSFDINFLLSYDSIQKSQSNGSFNTQYQERSSYTLQELWDEAEDVRNDAESALAEAENIGCNDAINAAQNSISHCDDCTNTNNYNDAYSFLDDAQSELSNAQSYLEDCQNNSENNSDNDENEDEDEDE
jgi:hypothetical protein